MMCRKEATVCPACGSTFECRHEAITRCRCADVPLTASQRMALQSRYAGCLCFDCLRRFAAEALDPGSAGAWQSNAE